MKINTIIELEELLATEEYNFEMPEKNYIREFETCNKWTHPSTLKLWDKMLEKTGLPPTPNDYLEEAFKMTEKFWYSKSNAGRIASYTYVDGMMQTTYMTWSEEIQIAIKNRLARMYRSFMAEYSAQVLLGELLPDSIMVASNELDLVAGVDIAVMNKKYDSSFLVHVTKDNKWTEDNIKAKSMKKMWMRDRSGKKHYYQREWNASHVVFGYTDYESESTKEVNGHLIFRLDYVNDRAVEAMGHGNQTYQDNEAIKLHHWLRENRIVKQGIKKMVVFSFGKHL